MPLLVSVKKIYDIYDNMPPSEKKRLFYTDALDGKTAIKTSNKNIAKE